MCELITVLLQPGFNGLNREALMHPDVTCMALEAAPMWLPLVFAWDPWLLTLLDEALFVLFGCMSSMSDWFLMQVVLGIFVDLSNLAAAWRYAS